MVSFNIKQRLVWVWGKLKRFGLCISENGSVSVSFCSFVVAVLAFYYTIHGQIEDSYYKELLIRPALNWEVSPEKHSVELINQGLGPAVIKKVVWGKDDKCFVSDPTDPQNWEKNRQEFQIFLNTYFLDEVAEATKTMSSLGKRPPTYSTVPTPGEIVPLGKSIELFGLSDPKTLEDALSTLTSEQRETFNNEFSQRLYSLKLLVGYCSVSERYCATTTVLGIGPSGCG